MGGCGRTYSQDRFDLGNDPLLLFPADPFLLLSPDDFNLPHQPGIARPSCSIE